MGFRRALGSYWRWFGCLCIATIACLLDSTANAQASGGVSILYFESLAAAPTFVAGVLRKAAPETLSFEAYGRRFEVQLESNDRIAPSLMEKSASGSLRLLRGSLTDVPGSWVRLSIGTTLRGMIWDGSELYLIEPAAEIRDSLVPPLRAGAGETLIFRLADTLIGAGIALCETPSAPASSTSKRTSGQDTYNSLVRELQTDLKGGAAGLQATGANLKLEISALGDTLFRAEYASDEQARNEILTRLNNVDGIYSTQLEVAIQAPVVNVSATATQSLSTTTVATDLLTSLGQLRSQTAELRSKGLTHLFTGRDLDDNTVGIAYRDALCRSEFGAALTEVRGRGSWIESLIAAHEIGHNFGAVHDGEESCNTVPAGQFLMSPSVNADHSTFSQCSIDTMRPRIQAASCITSLAPPDLFIASDLGTLHQELSRAFEIALPVRNVGGMTATGVHADLLVPPSIIIDSVSVRGGSCTSGGGAISCDLDEIPGGATREIQLTLHSDTLGSHSFSAHVAATGDTQLTNNSGDGTIVIDPEADAGPSTGPSTSPSSGGGGSTGPAFLLCLALVAAARGRIDRRRYADSFHDRSQC